MARGSAAWVIAILALVTGLIGSLILTVTDPVMQHLFDSDIWTSSTTFGSDALGWGQSVWTYWPVFILLGITVTVWIQTRRAG